MSWGYNPAFILLGATPAASANNMYRWLDGVVAQYSGPGSLVLWEGRRIPSLFDQLRQDQHSRVEQLLSNMVALQQDCLSNNLSAGMYISVEGAGKGACAMIPKILGPFMGQM